MKRALVTGSAAGLGEALADALLAGGWSVVGIDRAVRAPADGYEHLRVDLADPDAVDAVLADAAGPFDLVVLNAGISATGRFERLPAEAHARVLSVNAEAPLTIADGLLAGRALAPGAALVLVASLSVDVGYPGAASYAASKEAIAGYARSLRKRRGGPVVTVVHPGPIRTEHAARHAPPGASERSRMPAAELARRVLAGAWRGGTLRPGGAARAAGMLARLAPGFAARAMRRALFDRLDREVW